MSGSERNQRIDALLDAALDLPVREQDGFVERECATDPDLRRRVQGLLAAHRHTHTYVDTPRERASLSLATAGAPPRPRAAPLETPRLVPESVAHVAAGIDRHVVSRSMRVGLWVWPTFTLLDAYMCFVAFPGAPFRLFLLYRVVIEIVFAGVHRRSRRESADLRGLLVLQRLVYCATAFVIALMALHLGGVRSPYMHGISIVALVWAALVPMPWRRALPTFLGIGLAFPIVMTAAVIVSPAARAAWITADALKVFVSHYVFVLSSSMLGLILSNMVWRAQQEARSFGSYQLGELLGRGGMGEVWRARHRLLARSAAIKVIRSDALGGSAAARGIAIARFEREAQATASLRSPHTVDLYDFGVSETGAFYYVMELLDGFDAADLVQRFGPQPTGRVIHLLRQVCESLDEAHGAGLVHRDIKPSNIHICRYGRMLDFVKVLDFGLVKPVHGDDAKITMEFMVTGTPAFMSPEQVLGRAVDARADLYALGCVAYWLLTGRTVFEGTVMEVLAQQVSTPPVPLSQRVDWKIPEGLERLVLACLAKNPDDRPQTADALLARLIVLCQSHAWSQDDARSWWRQHDLELRSGHPH
jgi:serine/threonine-protein kinase